MRCFVTNADTYLGAVLCRTLVEGGHTVAATVLDTSEDGQQRRPKNVQIVPEEDSLSTALISEIIFHDIFREASLKSCEKLLKGLSERSDNFESEKTFVCISDLLTWARTKPADKEEPDVPISEEEYRRRKPHPESKPFHQTERLVLKSGKDNLATFVVSTGLMFGEGEDIFHYLFKDAWHNKPTLKCIGNGENFVPTIHVADAAKVLMEVGTNHPENRYIFAVDESKNTLFEIVERISYRLGQGGVDHIAPNDALLIEDLDVRGLQLLQVNLRLEGLTASSMEMEWECSEGLCTPTNISKVAESFKVVRKITPLRIAVVGPPASGKSFYAERLAKHYFLHHIQAAEAIKQAANRKDDLGEEVRSVLKGEDDEKANKKGDNDEYVRGPRLSDALFARVIRAAISSNKCLNQGYILDGIPYTVSQTELIFGGEDPEEEEDALEGDEDENPAADYTRPVPSSLVPEYVIELKANDEFLTNRIMSLPERLTRGTHNTEEGFNRRLKAYRAVTSDSLEQTALSMLEEKECLTITIDVSGSEADEKVVDDNDVEIDGIEKKVREFIGPPRNYGPSKQEVLDRIKAKKEAEEKKAVAEKKEKEEREKKEKEERERRLKEAAERVEKVKQQDRERLEAASLPLRGYLLDNVVPVLSEALVQVCRVRPEDPIDYLAEYLFRNNPKNPEVDA